MFLDPRVDPKNISPQTEIKPEWNALKHDSVLIFDAKKMSSLKPYDSKNVISRFYQ